MRENLENNIKIAEGCLHGNGKRNEQALAIAAESLKELHPFVHGPYDFAREFKEKYNQLNTRWESFQSE